MMIVRWIVLGTFILLAACVQKPPPVATPATPEAQARALLGAISTAARQRAATRPIPTSANAATLLGRDIATMLLATRCSGGVVAVTALFASADLAAEMDRLQQENPSLFNVAEIELLAQARRQAPSGAEPPQVCADALARMQQIMTRRPYLVRPRQTPSPNSV